MSLPLLYLILFLFSGSNFHFNFYLEEVALSPEPNEEHEAVHKVETNPDPALAERWKASKKGRRRRKKHHKSNLYKQKSIIHFLPNRSERAPKITPPTYRCDS